MNNTEDVLFKLIAAGLEACNDYDFPQQVDWQSIYKTT